ncbi:MAG: SDR family NAD(P)-dependent oxidoreductase [Sphingosinicella sp.]
MSRRQHDVRLVTVITGASAGIGAEFVRQCAERGDVLVLAARRRDRMDALVRETGARAHVIAIDLAQAGAAASLICQIEAEGMAVDLLINNAGFGLAGRFSSLPLERQREMLDLNIAALVELSHLVLPGMLERGRGSILNVASTAAFLPGPFMAVYYASKAFVLSFSQALHEEYKDKGIKVGALCPGPTATEFGAVAGSTSPVLERHSVTPAPVVKAALEGMTRNRPVIVPGIGNKAAALLGPRLPKGMVRRAVSRLNRGRKN